MVFDQPGDPLTLGVGEFQVARDPLGDLPADLLVVVEGGPTVGGDGVGVGLADVVEQGREGQFAGLVGGQQVKDQTSVIPEVAAGLRGLSLGETTHPRDRRARSR